MQRFVHYTTNLILKSNCITSLRIHNHWGIILWRLSDINLPFGPVFHCNAIFFLWQCQQLRTIQAAKNMTLNFWLWDIKFDGMAEYGYMYIRPCFLDNFQHSYNVLDFKVWLTNFEFLTFFS